MISLPPRPTDAPGPKGRCGRGRRPTAWLALVAILVQVLAQALVPAPATARTADVGADGPVMVLCIGGTVRHVPLAMLESGQSWDEILAALDAAPSGEDDPRILCPACLIGLAGVLSQPSGPSVPAVYGTAIPACPQTGPVRTASDLDLPLSRGPPRAV